MVSAGVVARLLADPVLVLASSLALAGLLLGAAIHKLRQPGQFLAALAAYGLLPARMTAAVWWSIPLGESVLALSLLDGATRPLAAAGVTMLLLGYASVMALALARGRRLDDCGCSLGHTRQPVSGALVWRNVLLALMAVNLSREATPRGLGPYDWALVLVIALAGGALYAVANALIATHGYTRALRHD